LPAPRYLQRVLLREDSDGLVAIGQTSHAWIAGQLARAWGNEQFPAPVPREEVCLAAEQHDIGWAEWDLRPSLNARTGRPHSFLELPVEAHLSLWRSAPDRMLSQSRYAALLVSMHGTALNERRDLTKLDPGRRELVLDYLARQRELQSALAEQVGAEPDEIKRNQRLVSTWDALSIAVCVPRPERVLRDVPGRYGPLELTLRETGRDRFALDPWPFADECVEVVCEGRRLRRPYATEQELGDALSEAPSVRLAFTLRRAPQAIV
jgi:hypothetical protein